MRYTWCTTHRSGTAGVLKAAAYPARSPEKGEWHVLHYRPSRRRNSIQRKAVFRVLPPQASGRSGDRRELRRSARRRVHAPGCRESDFRSTSPGTGRCLVPVRQLVIQMDHVRASRISQELLPVFTGVVCRGRGSGASLNSEAQRRIDAGGGQDFVEDDLLFGSMCRFEGSRPENQGLRSCREKEIAVGM